MQLKLLKSLFVVSVAVLSSPIFATRPVLAQGTGFFCGTFGNSPATMLNQQGKSIPVILWDAADYFAESGEDATTRCTRVSGLLNSYRQQGNLERTIATSKSRTGQPIICAANQEGDCRLLYQVPRGQSPEQARQELIRRVSNPTPNISPIRVN